MANHATSAFPDHGKRTAKQQGIYELESESRRLRMEREILKKLLLSSMDRCNTIEILFDMEGVAYSTIRPSWSFEFSESGGVGAEEAGKVVERHWPCPGKGMPVRSTALSLPTAESSRYQGDGLAWPSRWRSEKRFREGLPGGYPSGAWPINLGGLHQRSVAKLSDMAGAVGIMPRWPMMRHGRTRVAPNPVGLPFIPSYSRPLLIN